MLPGKVQAASAWQQACPRMASRHVTWCTFESSRRAATSSLHGSYWCINEYLPHPYHTLPQHDKVGAISGSMLLARCGVGVRGGKLGVHAI